MDNSYEKSYLKSPILITVVSLTVMYVIAYVIDISLRQLKRYAGDTFNFRPAILFSSVAPIVIVIGILALTWLALRYLPPNRFVGIAFLISGLFVIVMYLSYFVGLPLWLRTTIIGRFRYAMMDFGLQSSIYYVASACVILGIVALRRYAVKDRDSSQGK